MKKFIISTMLITALNAPSFANEGIPLEKAIEIAVNEAPGKVIQAEFEEGIYEVKIRTENGERIKFKINSNGAIIRKGKIVKGSSKGFSKPE